MVKYIESNLGEHTNVTGELTEGKVDWIVNELQLEINPAEVYMIERVNIDRGSLIIFKHGIEDHRDILIERSTTEYYKLNQLRREATEKLEGANELDKIYQALREAQEYQKDKCVSNMQAMKYFQNKLEVV